MTTMAERVSSTIITLLLLLSFVATSGTPSVLTAYGVQNTLTTVNIRSLDLFLGVRAHV
jgi:hypothetical protein